MRVRGLEGGLADPGFEALLSEIDDSVVHPGNRIEVYTSGDRAFAAMREAIRGARQELLVESYIWRDDATGRELLDELCRAVERGVTVRALADAIGSFETRREFWREMAARGIETRRFHPLVSELWNHLYRDHRKILVVDRQIAFTGGMNIMEESGSFPLGGRGLGSGSGSDRGAAAGTGQWRDTHVRLAGPAAREMAVVFAEGWERARGTPFEIEPPPEEGEEPAADGGEGAGVLVLDARPNRGYAEAASILTAIVTAARERVWITNAYFAPRRAAVRILGSAAQRGVDVRLLLPGLTDVPIVRHAGHGFYKALLDRGVRIFEYQPAILHAKSMVADGLASVVGSTNLDFRSFHFNAECNLVILDRPTGARLERAFEDDLAKSEEIVLETWRRRGVLHKLGDRLARTLSPLL